jgi:hypothetical protein
VSPRDDDTVEELVVTTLAAGLAIDLTATRDPLELVVERISQDDLLLVVDTSNTLQAPVPCSVMSWAGQSGYAGRPGYVAYAAEAYTGVPETALDLIAAGHGDRHDLDGIVDRGLAGLRSCVRSRPDRRAASRPDRGACRACAAHGGTSGGRWTEPRRSACPGRPPWRAAIWCPWTVEPGGRRRPTDLAGARRVRTGGAAACASHAPLTLQKR